MKTITFLKTFFFSLMFVSLFSCGSKKDESKSEITPNGNSELLFSENNGRPLTRSDIDSVFSKDLKTMVEEAYSEVQEITVEDFFAKRQGSYKLQESVYGWAIVQKIENLETAAMIGFNIDIQNPYLPKVTVNEFEWFHLNEIKVAVSSPYVISTEKNKNESISNFSTKLNLTMPDSSDNKNYSFHLSDSNVVESKYETDISYQKEYEKIIQDKNPNIEISFYKTANGDFILAQKIKSDENGKYQYFVLISKYKHYEK